MKRAGFPQLILIAVGILIVVSGLVNDSLRAWPYWVIWIGTSALYLLLTALTYRMLVSVTLWSCAVISLIGIAQVTLWWLGCRGDDLVLWRPNSIVYSCNILGQVALWGAIIAWMERRWYLLAVLAFTIVLSGSRTAAVAGVAAILVYVWHTYPKLRLAACTAFCGLVAVGYVVSTAMGRLPIYSRVEIWRASAGIGAGLLGPGPGTLKAMLPLSTQYGSEVWHAHNLYLQAWGDLGVYGVLVAIVLGCCAIDDTLRSGSVWLMMYAAATVVSSMTEYLYWLPGIGVLALVVYDILRREPILVECNASQAGRGDSAALV